LCWLLVDTARERAASCLLPFRGLKEVTMSLRINDTAPDFQAETTQGPIKFHEWIGDSWAILFSHPKDFTPVCTTELGYMAKIEPEFKRRNVKLIGLSVDPVDSHGRWMADIEETQGAKVGYPIIGDSKLEVSKLYNMLPAEETGTSEGRTPVTNQTVRSVFVIGPDKKIKLMMTYPMTTGRNFDEILRVVDSMQLTLRHKVATPVNWKQGEDVIIAGSVNDEEAKKLFPQGWKAVKPYLRVVKQPSA
jgi:thioredoxin-dependent peroxiredoxin